MLNGEFTTVDEAFRALLTTHAALRDRVLTEIGDIRQNVNVFVGSNEVKRLKGLQTEMRGNEIHIFNAISGGYRRFKGKLVRPLESTFEIGGDRGLLSCSSLLRHEHR